MADFILWVTEFLSLRLGVVGSTVVTPGHLLSLGLVLELISLNYFRISSGNDSPMISYSGWESDEWRTVHGVPEGHEYDRIDYEEWLEENS